jgi:hypothetical protein
MLTLFYSLGLPVSFATSGSLPRSYYARPFLRDMMAVTITDYHVGFLCVSQILNKSVDSTVAGCLDYVFI